MPAESSPSGTDALSPIARQIWDLKYRLRDVDGQPVDQSIDDTFARVARAAAVAEKGGKRAQGAAADRFHAAMSDFGFLPAGRILAGAGTGRDVTLFNCFVMGRIEDDLGAIFDGVKEAALTMQQGGGIGHDFSTLRPKGALVRSIGADASGPVSFMDVWDAMCRTIMSAGARRGAMMATLRCDHPDIEAFVAAKSDPARLRNFNLSVLVTDRFLAAVRDGSAWDLMFGGRVYRTVDARALWRRIMRATYDYAEPGVIFIDRVNALNNLAYCEEIHATNPCGEQPLPYYGACLLGSINLARLVDRPFAPGAAIPLAALETRVATAVRLLDNVIDISNYPLAAQQREAKAKRRIGLGVTGLADALILCGLRYGAPEALAQAERWMAAIQAAAYRASAELAAEKGAFENYEAGPFLAAPNVARLDASVRAAIQRHGIRNGCLTSIAPTGTISLFAGNVSSGVEPVFDLRYRRRVLGASGTAEEIEVEDYAHALWRGMFGDETRPGPQFVTARALGARQHLEMQAALQRHVDSAISKTINCPEDMSFQEFEDIYLEAHALGLKGCTTYRPNPVTGAVLVIAAEPVEAGVADAQDDDAPAKAVVRAGAVSAYTPPPQAEAAAEAVPQGGGLDAHQSAPQGLSQSGLERRSASGELVVGAGERGDVVYMARPLERDAALSGYTYKLRWPGSDHAIYVTINDIERDGRRRPFEIFINTKNLEHYAWTVALTRMISAVFRRGGDVSFVVEELKAVFDPQGGQWMGGRYVPSLLAAIGDVIEAHMVRTGFLQPDGPRLSVDPMLARRIEGAAAVAEAVREAGEGSGHGGQAAGRPTGALAGPPASESTSGAGLGIGASAGGRTGARSGGGAGPRANVRFCPRCSSTDYVREEGCWVCHACGYARCS